MVVAVTDFRFHPLSTYDLLSSDFILVLLVSLNLQMSSDIRNFPPFPNYTKELESKLLRHGVLSPELVLKTNELLDKLQKGVHNVLPELKKSSDYSVYTGYTGIAFMEYTAYLRTHNKEHFKKAKELVQEALQHLKGKRISFLNGDAGPLALGAVLNLLDKNDKEANNLIQRLIKLGELDDPSLPDEMLYGRAGYVYALLFVDETSPVIPEGVIRKHVAMILHSGSKLSKKNNSSVPLEYEWHDKSYLGAAHGFAGILYILLNATQYTTDYELNFLIKPTLDWLISLRFPNGNFPSSIGNKADRLVQWCHGAPGFINLLTLASYVFKDEKYLDIAKESAEVVWSRGLLKKGYSICHGVTGNAYSFLHLYKVTKDVKYMYKAASFLDWVLRYPLNEGLKPDRPYSLYEGRAGIVNYLLDMKEPLDSTFPAYELKYSKF